MQLSAVWAVAGVAVPLCCRVLSSSSFSVGCPCVSLGLVLVLDAFSLSSALLWRKAGFALGLTWALTTQSYCIGYGVYHCQSDGLCIKAGILVASLWGCGENPRETLQ